MTEQTAGFEIDGEHYDIPRLDGINLDEERIMYVYSDTVLADFADPHPDEDELIKRAMRGEQARKIRNPEFKRALAHIAYKRRHPDLDDVAIQEALGKVNALELDLAILQGRDDDPPKTSQKQPENAKSSSEHSTSSDSGRATESISASQAVTLARIGTSESDTSSRPSPVRTSA